MTTLELARIKKLQLLTEVATSIGLLAVDLIHLGAEAAAQVLRFKKQEEKEISTLLAAAFWMKALGRAFFTAGDGISFAIRSRLPEAASAAGVGLSEKELQNLDIKKHVPLERALPLSLRSMARFYGVEAPLDTSGEDFRGFKAFAQCREKFVHPKRRREIYPFEIFRAISPSIEWMLLAWRRTLLDCSAAVGFARNPKITKRRFRIRDSDLDRMGVLQEKYEAGFEQSPISDFTGGVLDLMKDTERAKEATAGRGILTPVPRESALRNLVGTLFSEIEGTTFLAKALLHEHCGAAAPEKSLLTGEPERVRGRIVEVLELFSASFGDGIRIEKGGEGWEAFLVCRHIRNRLTHPRSTADLRIEPQEEKGLFRLLRWWRDSPLTSLRLNGDKAVKTILGPRLP